MIQLSEHLFSEIFSNQSIYPCRDSVLKLGLYLWRDSVLTVFIFGEIQFSEQGIYPWRDSILRVFIFGKIQYSLLRAFILGEIQYSEYLSLARFSTQSIYLWKDSVLRAFILGDSVHRAFIYGLIYSIFLPSDSDSEAYLLGGIRTQSIFQCNDSVNG